MVRVKVLDEVAHAYSDVEGKVVHEIVVNHLKAGRPVEVSFEGVDAISTSFVNNAFIALLEDFTFDDIKRTISFVHTNAQINDMLRSRFKFETSGARAVQNQH